MVHSVGSRAVLGQSHSHGVSDLILKAADHLETCGIGPVTVASIFLARAASVDDSNYCFKQNKTALVLTLIINSSVLSILN